VAGRSPRCDNPVFATAETTFNALRAPMLYVFGDNGWTDCHRTNNGGYNNLERLTCIRLTMFASTMSFGQ
jgi:hypothetical protein